MSIVFGTPTTGASKSAWSRDATPSVSSPPIATSASMCSKAARTASTPPSSLYGFVREVPTIVPPRGRIPEICGSAERLEELVDHPAPAFPDADHLVAVRPRAPRDRADDRVQAGTVAAAGEDSDSHDVAEFTDAQHELNRHPSRIAAWSLLVAGADAPPAREAARHSATRAVPRRCRLHVLDARRAARSHRPAAGDAASSRSARQTTSRRRTACCSCCRAGRASRGCRFSTASSTGRSPPRRGSTGSWSSTSAGPAPARSTARRCSSRWALGSLPADRGRGARVRCEARRRGGSSTGPTTSSPTSTRSAGRSASTRSPLDGISYGTYVGERYALAHPDHVSKLVLDSVVPHVGLSDLGVVEFRGDRARPAQRLRKPRASPTSPRSSSAITTASTCSTRSPPTASSTRPTGRCSTSRRAARGAQRRTGPARVVHREHARRRPGTRRRARPGPARERALRRLAVSVGQLGGAARRPRRGARSRAVAKLPASALYPFDRATATGNGFIRQCLPVGADAADAARPREDHASRRCS